MPLEIEELEPGDGPPCQAGDIVRVRTVMWIAATRKLFERDDEQGLTVAIGTPVTGMPRMIDGMDQGTIGMRVGGVRKLRIPYQLAYGEKGARDYDEDRKLGWIFPPKSDFIAEIELLEIVKPASGRVEPKTATVRAKPAKKAGPSRKQARRRRSR